MAIVAKEKEYTRRLADYIRGSSFGEQWQVSAFTHPGACKQYAKQGYSIDLIAAEPELLRELRPELCAIPSVALVAKSGESGGEAEVLQFQALPLLLKGLAEGYSAMIGRSVHYSPSQQDRGDTKVLTIHSASGGVGKTTLALHLANAAAARGRKVFYLNMERWDTSGLWLHGQSASVDAGSGLSELLYEIKTGSSESSQWIAKHRKYHPLLKCDYMSGFRNVEDRILLEAEDALAIVEAVGASAGYDIIIVDMDAGMDDMQASLLGRADRNLWLIADSLPSAAKQSCMQQYGGQKWGERFASIAAKSLIVLNRSQGIRARGHNSFDVTQSPIQLPEVTEWRGVELPPLLSSSSYRAAADQLLSYAMREKEIVHAV
ncbi:AAA family ATPase [Paenibacillus sp. PL2-23]|uniref:nucleotide-binding protein n=1 Tax=Paenibacillus sp. PL2-23 TaxID=2100729 RepID=UPI0030F86DCC